MNTIIIAICLALQFLSGDVTISTNDLELTTITIPISKDSSVEEIQDAIYESYLQEQIVEELEQLKVPEYILSFARDSTKVISAAAVAEKTVDENGKQINANVDIISEKTFVLNKEIELEKQIKDIVVETLASD